jgi:hypothetical protein
MNPKYQLTRRKAGMDKYAGCVPRPQRQRLRGVNAPKTA